MKYFIIAGEASGDLHASNLMLEIQRIDPKAKFMGMGGDRMESVGLKLVAHMKDFAIMGFWEVLTRIFSIFKLQKLIKSAIQEFNPDRLILVDYGGFNLRIAKYAKRKAIPVHFYILPKVWAWNEGRIKKIAKYVDGGYVIFPFEEVYFKKGNVNATYVGNPVVTAVKNYLLNGFKEERHNNQIALLPGSRNQELKHMLPIMLSVVTSFSNYQFIIAATEPNDLIPALLPPNVTVVYNKTYSILHTSRMAVVTSGTANLETALLNTPQVVVYHTSPLSYAIGKRMVKIKYISPVNLILSKLVVTELIQNDFNAVNLEREIERCLDASEVRKIEQGYNELKSTLGEKNAAYETAKLICLEQEKIKESKK